MARKKMRKFKEGGTSDEIVVVGGKKPSAMEELSTFNLSRIGGGSGMGGGLGTGMVGSGGGSGGGSGMGGGKAPATPRRNFSIGKVNTPAGSVYGPRYGNDRFNIGAGLGRGALGNADAPVAGISGSLRFKSGGKADGEPTGGKKRTKAKKYATGGSTASKRADGCATKGKTKGRFV